MLADVGQVKGADDLFPVVSQSGTEYLVDRREGGCTCPDHEHRGVRCKHLRRVAFAESASPFQSARSQLIGRQKLARQSVLI